MAYFSGVSAVMSSNSLRISWISPAGVRVSRTRARWSADSKTSILTSIYSLISTCLFLLSLGIRIIFLLFFRFSVRFGIQQTHRTGILDDVAVAEQVGNRLRQPCTYQQLLEVGDAVLGQVGSSWSRG